MVLHTVIQLQKQLWLRKWFCPNLIYSYLFVSVGIRLLLQNILWILAQVFSTALNHLYQQSSLELILYLLMEKQSLRSLVTNWWEEAICEAFGWRQSLIFICLLSVLMGLIFNRWSWMFHATPFLCGATEVSGGHRSSVGGRGRITAQHPLELGSKSLREAPGWPRLTVRDTLDQKHLSNLFTFSHSTLCGSQESNLFWSN